MATKCALCAIDRATVALTRLDGDKLRYVHKQEHLLLKSLATACFPPPESVAEALAAYVNRNFVENYSATDLADADACTADLCITHVLEHTRGATAGLVTRLLSEIDADEPSALVLRTIYDVLAKRFI